MPLTRIVFPVDFSASCEQAGPFLRSLAGRFGAEIVMVHVLEPFERVATLLEVNGAMIVNLRQEWIDRAHSRLEKFLAEQLPAAERVLLEGEPGMEIPRLARARHADWILMPAHGFSLMRRFVLGSVAARVLHEADCPVLTFLPGAELRPVHSILCAVNLSEHSEAALRQAADLARLFDAELTVIHASPVVMTPSTAAMEGDFTTRFAADARQSIGELLGKLHVRAKVCVHPGEPASVISEAARQHQSDLLVIGRGAVKGGLGRLRAHSYSIVNQAPCPALSV